MTTYNMEFESLQENRPPLGGDARGMHVAVGEPVTKSSASNLQLPHSLEQSKQGMNRGRAFGDSISNTVNTRRGTGLSDLQDAIRSLRKGGATQTLQETRPGHAHAYVGSRDGVEKARTPSAPMFDSQGDVVMGDAVITPVVLSGTKNDIREDVFQTPKEGYEGNDPATEGKRLAQQMQRVAEQLSNSPVVRQSEEEDATIVIRNRVVQQHPVRRLDSASTEERPKPMPRRCSILADGMAPILDLNGFDAHGDRRRNSIATPVIRSKLSPENERPMPKAPDATAGNLEKLQKHIQELEMEKEEATSLLESYQGSIAKLQDAYSKDTLTLKNENKLMETEVERLRKERQQIHDQFAVLYNRKYLPLKQEATALRESLKMMQERTENLNSAQDEIQLLRNEIQTLKKSEEALKNSVEAAEARAQAAVESEQLAHGRLESERQKDERKISQLVEQIRVLESKRDTTQDEIDRQKEKYDSLRQHLEESMHRCEVACAGYERKKLEVTAREEEVYTLQVENKELRKRLDDYRAENEKFYHTREKYRAQIRLLMSERRGQEGSLPP